MEKCTELWGLEEFGEMGNKGKMALLLGKGCRAGHSTCTFRYFSYIVLDHCINSDLNIIKYLPYINTALKFFYLVSFLDGKE